MGTQLIVNHIEGAEIYNGESICKQKSLDLLSEIELPKSLLNLNNLIEVGYNRTTDFVWLKQKNRTDHRFRAIGCNVSCDNEVTAFVENHWMRRLTGFNSKEILIWISISEIYVDDPNSGKTKFKTSTCLSRTFSIFAFEEK